MSRYEDIVSSVNQGYFTKAGNFYGVPFKIDTITEKKIVFFPINTFFNRGCGLIYDATGMIETAHTAFRKNLISVERRNDPWWYFGCFEE